MTATYSGDPALSNRDAVRFLIRDTDVSSAKVSDEEIDWLLSQANDSVYTAAVQAAESVISSYMAQTATTAGEVKTKTVGALSISKTGASEIVKEYRGIVGDLRRRMALNTPFIPYAGGISVADKEINSADTDWDKPAFVRKIHDYPHSEVWREELTDWPST